MTQLSLNEAERLVRAGAEALSHGRAADARRNFEQVAKSGRANVQVWLLLAHACLLAGDHRAAEQAVDEVLRHEAGNVRANIQKGDCRLAAGDTRAASSFYGAAVRHAARMPQLPPDLQREIGRIERKAAELSRGYRAQLVDRLEEAGLAPDERTARFEESIAILLGEKQLYLQQPTAYYFPGLPQRQFYEREEFAWAAEVEAATPAVLAELAAYQSGGAGGFRPYLQQDASRPASDYHSMLNNPDWSTLYLFENGAASPALAGAFDQTLAAVRRAPLPVISTRAPSVLLSLLRPGARIAPHHGMINARLICHLPLIVPGEGGLRVGNEVRRWEVGKLLIFDDSIEHEAWNDSDRDRIVLIFDVWRPELTAGERRAVSAVFEAIDAQET